MNVSHLLDVRDKPGLLQRLMHEFAGGQISLEGDLSRCVFADELVISRDEAGLLKRATLNPRQEFVILNLNAANITQIMKQILAAGLSRAIIHVQIAHDGVLQFRAYDNFHPDCVVAGPEVSEVLLAELKSQRVLRDYSLAK